MEPLQDAIGLSDRWSSLLLSLAVVLALLLVRGLLLAVVHWRTDSVRARYRWRKGSMYVALLVGLVLIVQIWAGTRAEMATFLGLLTAGLAIALKDLIVNLAAWQYILWKRPLEVGDRITIKGFTGDVIDLGLFQFTLLEVGTKTGAPQSTGRMIHIPNGQVFAEAVVNFTHGFPYVWNEVAVPLAFESDWKAAKALLLDIAERHAMHLSEDAERKVRAAARDYLIFYQKLTPTVYTTLRPWGIELTLRYIEEPRRLRNSEETIWEAILEALQGRTDIGLAYTTTRVVNFPPQIGLGTILPPDARDDEASREDETKEQTGEPRTEADGGQRPPRT